MSVKTISTGPFALLALLLPTAAPAKSISSSPSAIANVPVDHPLALGVLLAILFVA